jgi:hypothetical protein
MRLMTTPEKFLLEQENAYFKAIQRNQLPNVVKILEETENAEIPTLEDKTIVNHLIQKKSGNTGIHVCATLGFFEILK